MNNTYLGIVTQYDELAGSGTVVTTSASVLDFAYSQGQSVLAGDDIMVPRLSGRHRQPAGSKLKSPCVGDPIVFSTTAPNQIDAWGYARHFVETAERRISDGIRFDTA